MKIRAWLRTSIQVCTVMSCGDLCCQFLEFKFDKNKKNLNFLQDQLWDRERTKRMSIVGFFVQGPWAHGNYQMAEYFFPGTSNKAVLCKVLLGRAIAPIGICLTFSTVIFLKGLTLQDAIIKIKRDMPTTWATGALYWPFVRALNFKYIPLHNRPLVGSIFGSFWSVWMSY